MRTLSAELLLTQTQGYPTGGYQPAVRCILTALGGSPTYDYSVIPSVITNRTLAIEQTEHVSEGDTGVIRVNSYDRAVPVDLTGYYVDLGFGLLTPDGVKWDESNGAVVPRLWVTGQKSVSGAPKNGVNQIIIDFTMGGAWEAVLNKQELRIGTDPFYRDETGLLANMTIYGVLEYLIETSLSSQTGYAFTLDPLGDQDDSLISSIKPFEVISSGSFVVGRTYRIYTVGSTDYVAEQGASGNTVGIEFTAIVAGTGSGTATFALAAMNQSTPSTFETYGAYIKRLLKLTKCALRPEAGLAFKIVWPQDTDATTKTYYSSASLGHPFYELMSSRSATIPNHIEVHGGQDANDLPTVMGEWYDSNQYTTVTAGSFTVGKVYHILTVGTTDFTLIGASANTIGVVFTATGVGSGIGTAVTYTGSFMPVQESIWANGFLTIGDCADVATALGQQWKEEQLSARIIIPMDAGAELWDRIGVLDIRGVS